ATLMGGLGLAPDTDPRTVLLPPGAGERLTMLYSRRSGVVERAEAARVERDEAERAIDAARQAAGADEDVDSADEDVVATLSLAVRTIRSADLASRHRDARRQTALAAQALDAARARLHPWTGDVAALHRLPLPSAAQLKGL